MNGKAAYAENLTDFFQIDHRQRLQFSIDNFHAIQRIALFGKPFAKSQIAHNLHRIAGKDNARPKRLNKLGSLENMALESRFSQSQCNGQPAYSGADDTYRSVIRSHAVILHIQVGSKKSSSRRGIVIFFNSDWRFGFSFDNER